MKSINGQLSIHTGETFTIDFTFVNGDGSPYIISSGLNNPYFLITVSSNKYREESSYLLNYWSKVDFIPRFENTNCIDITSIDSTYTDWNTIPLPSGYNSVGQYIQNGETKYFANKAVFYLEDEDGNTTYKFWLYDGNPAGSSGYSGSWVDYNLRLVKNFTQTVTKNWTNGTYYYSITLISGQDMIDYLRNLCQYQGISFEQSDTVLDLYNKLVESGYEFNKDFSVNRPIYDYDTVYPLVTPSALIVMSSLNGDI